MTDLLNFTSVYSFSPYENSYKKTSRLQRFLNEDSAFQVADNLYMQSNEKSIPSSVAGYSSMINSIPYYHKRHGLNVVAPYSKTGLLEAFCAQKGIKFNKSEGAEVDVKKVLSKIKKPKGNMMLAFVNSKKLEEIADFQFSNIEDCKYDYVNNYADIVSKMLVNEDEIPATTLCLLPSSSSKKDLTDYIANFGPKNLQDRQLIAEFEQRTYKPDHCVYFALKNLGMKYIPVYVDYDSYDIGVELGILSNEI